MRARQMALVPAAALVGMVALSGCGGDSGADAQNGGGGFQRGEFQQLFADYTACMKDNGVTITLPSRGPQGGGDFTPPADGTRPSGVPGEGGVRPSGAPASGRPDGGRGPGSFFQKPDGVSEKTWTAAQKACESKLPQRGNGAPQPSAS